LPANALLATTLDREPITTSTGSAVVPLRSCSLFGFDFLNTDDLDAIAERILGPQPLDGLLPLVVTPNVDYIVHLNDASQSEFARALQQARYVLPDGQPIVWTSRFAGDPLAARLPGSTLFPVVWRGVVAQRRRALVVAASHETADLMRREHPDAGFVVPPMFDADDPDQLAVVVEACRASMREVQPEFVFVGISLPKQQKIALALIDACELAGETPPLFLLLGASHEMYLGLVKRAPSWMQSFGLEWFYRFVKEPKRLFRRYFINDTRFVWLLVRELARLRRAAPEQPAIASAHRGAA